MAFDGHSRKAKMATGHLSQTQVTLKKYFKNLLNKYLTPQHPPPLPLNPQHPAVDFLLDPPPRSMDRLLLTLWLNGSPILNHKHL